MKIGRSMLIIQIDKLERRQKETSGKCIFNFWVCCL